MRLVLTQAPGRATRKARDFGGEIVELRALGYTLEAIRVALANAGVHVTISTVWREAQRATGPQDASPFARTTSPRSPPPAAVGPPAASASHSNITPHTRTQRRKGKDVAEAFMRDQITNPLLRSKEPR